MLSALTKEAPKKKTKSAVDFSNVPMTGRARSVSISTRESMVDRLEHIRDELNLKSTNSVVVYALRLFIAKYDEGTSGIENFVVVPEAVKSSLKMDGER